MKCPECGVNHRTLEKALLCKNPIDNEYGHYIILCSNFKDGVTEQNCKHMEVSWTNCQRIIRHKTAIKEYLLKKFNYKA